MFRPHTATQPPANSQSSIHLARLYLRRQTQPCFRKIVRTVDDPPPGTIDRPVDLVPPAISAGRLCGSASSLARNPPRERPGFRSSAFAVVLFANHSRRQRSLARRRAAGWRDGGPNGRDAAPVDPARGAGTTPLGAVDGSMQDGESGSGSLTLRLRLGMLGGTADDGDGAGRKGSSGSAGRERPGLEVREGKKGKTPGLAMFGSEWFRRGVVSGLREGERVVFASVVCRERRTLQVSSSETRPLLGFSSEQLVTPLEKVRHRGLAAFPFVSYRSGFFACISCHLSIPCCL